MPSSSRADEPVASPEQEAGLPDGHSPAEEGLEQSEALLQADPDDSQHEQQLERDLDELVKLSAADIEVTTMTGQLAGRESPYRGHAGLAQYLDEYNFRRVHNGRLTRGRIPADIVYGANKVKTR